MKAATKTPAAKTSKKNSTKKFRPWQKNGKTAERFELKGVQPGEKIKFLLNGKMVVGTYKYGKSSVRHPEGKVYIEKGGKNYKRTLEHIALIGDKEGKSA